MRKIHKNNVSNKGKAPRNRNRPTATICDLIAVVDALADEHWQSFTIADVKVTSGIRTKWLKALVRLSTTPARSIGQATTKADYLRDICQVCLSPLASRGIAAHETFVIVNNLRAEIRSWGLPVPGDTQH